MKKDYIALLYTFVEKKRSEELVKKYTSWGFSGGTVLDATGAANSFLWRLMGFDGPERTVILNLIDSSMLSSFLKEKSEAEKSVHFQSALVPLNREKVKSTLEAENIMDSNLSIVQVICNNGSALEVMEKARSFGAKGGTILDARGTAREEDEMFFGNKLVKEKEIVLIIADNDTSKKIIEGIENMPSMKEDGAGIVFALPVSYFSKTAN